MQDPYCSLTYTLIWILSITEQPRLRLADLSCSVFGNLPSQNKSSSQNKGSSQNNGIQAESEPSHACASERGYGESEFGHAKSEQQDGRVRTLEKAQWEHLALHVHNFEHGQRTPVMFWTLGMPRTPCDLLNPA